MNKLKRRYTLSPQNNVFWREHQVNGRMILPLDNYLMMIVKAVSSYSSDYLSISNLEIHRPIIAETLTQAVKLQLYCDEQGFCSIALIHQDNSEELILTCGLKFTNQLPSTSLIAKHQSPMRPGNFSGSNTHFLGNSYHLTTSFNLNKGSLTGIIDSKANATSIIAGLLHGPMHCQDELIASNHTPELPHYIEHICLSIQQLSQASVLCANQTSSCLFDENDNCIASLEGFNQKQHQFESTDIAIIGMAGMFPQSKNLSEFWQNLCQGFDGITPLGHRGNLNFSKEQYAGWLKDVFDFDNSYFHISDTEAKVMDPQQRLFLSVVDDCLVDAGYDKERLKHDNCGVYVGACQSSYRLHFAQNAIAQSFWGNAPSVIAGRVAYHYDLHGPAVVFDTACSSSLVAIHHAIKSLQEDSCSLAIAGGVFLMLDDSFIQGAEKAAMLSPEHACKAFSDHANGFVPGEAVAAILLKPYDKAKADGDRIYACIKSSAINQDGLSNGITAPNGEAQSQLLKAVYGHPEIDLEQLAVIEAHGTGTKLGDPIEVHALTDVMEASNLKPGSVALGSVKSNIGHTIHAAGIAGVIKTALAAYTHTIPPTNYCETLNHHIDFDNSPVAPITEVRSWPKNKPYAGVSSFGFSGTNAHVLIEQVHSQPQELIQTPSKQANKQRLYWHEQQSDSIPNDADYFADHVVNGQPILPGVASLAIAHKSIDKTPCLISDVRWLKPLTQTSNELHSIKINIDNGKLSLKTDTQGIFFEGNVSHSDNLIPDLRQYPVSHLSSEIAVTDLYSRFSEMGIDYGSSLRNIMRLSYNEVYAMAEIRTDRAVNVWHVNPYILDCALQTVACFTLMNRDELSIPSHAGKICIYKPLISNKCIAVSYKRSDQIFDIALFNDDKQLCVFIEGLHAVVIEQKHSDKQNPVPQSAETLSLVYEIFSRRLQIKPERLRQILGFSELGIDSLMGLDIIMDLEEHYGSLPKTLLIDCTNFSELANFLQNIDKPKPKSISSDEQLIQAIPSSDQDIAIIGIAVDLPNADNLEALFDILSTGQNCITRDSNWQYPYAARLSSANQFDALFFSIAPTDAMIMSPQERRMLQNAWHCFESAGVCIDGRPKSISVYIGAMNNDYQIHGFEQSQNQLEPVIANSTSASIANRISSIFNLTGTSICIDTMCSSSLTAVDMACKTLRQGQADMVLAGGVNIISHNYKYQELLYRNMLSDTGHCASFGETADGYVPSEGVVSVLLKPLSQAKKDNDHIYAVIKGSATNHNGQTSGYTVPNSSMQAQVIQAALADANLDASQLSYVECHGTGTKLGDPIEMNGLTNIFHDNKNLVIGSIKSNYGHLEAAAGLAGLVKVVLQMQSQQLFPSLHSNTLNPEVNLGKTMTIPQTKLSWTEAKGGQAYAGVSSFGAGGSNAHVVLSNYKPAKQNEDMPSGPYLFVFSGKTQIALKRNIEAVRTWLYKHGEVNPYRLGYTLALARTHFHERAAFVADDTQQLLLVLDDYLIKQESHNHSDSELAPLYQAYMNGDSCHFDTLYKQPITVLGELPGYQFEDKTYTIAKNSPKTAELHYSSIQFLEEELNISAQPKSNLFLLTSESRLATCLTWGIENSSIFVWQGDHCWKTPQGKVLKTSDLCVNEGDVVVDMLGDEGSLTEHLFLIQQLLNDKPIRKLLHLIDSDGGVNGHIIAYYLNCQSQLRHRFHARSLEFTNQNTISISLLQQEAQACLNYDFIRYQDKKRYRKAISALDTEPMKPISIDSRKLHIITGGTSGLGASCAEWLVEQGAKKLVLCGRTTLPQETLWQYYLSQNKLDKVSKIIQLIEGLRRKGCEVFYYTTPLDDSSQFENWLGLILQTGQSIGYILHCAGTTPTYLSENNQFDEELLTTMLSSKLLVTRRLISTIEKFGYDKCILFSSVSSVFPTLASGVIEYGLANAALNAVAEQRNDDKIVSVVWPAWQHSANDIKTNKHYQRLGLGVLSNQQAFSALTKVLSNQSMGPLVLPSEQLIELESPKVASVREEERDNLKQRITNAFIDVVGLTKTELNPQRRFEEYGVDSVLLINFLKRLESIVGRDLQPELILENNTLDKLHHALSSQVNVRAPVEQVVPITAQKNTEKVAIIGMACHFANSPNIEAFWQLLSTGQTAIKQIPAGRVDNPSFSDVYGGFIDDNFNHYQHFGFKEEQWVKLHPIIQLTLVLVDSALKDAGLSKQSIAGKAVGVFVGSRVPDNNPNATVDGFSMIGRGQNFVAAHINHFYDLKGPSEVIDTACSSSLVALKHAISALNEGDIDMAIVAGCDFLDNTKPFAYMQEAGALSPNYQSRPFDARANGIVLSEGGGVVILQALKRAQSEQRTIYSVIESVAVNNDGHTMGYTTPNPESQSKVVSMALRKAGLSPKDLNYVEMHATGTELGDPMELKALNQVFSEGEDTHTCYVGSVKANIGHSLSAAGMAGLIKTVLCSYHQCLLAQPGELQLAKRYRFDNSSLQLLGQNRPLANDIHHFGVSAFGFGGTNAHVIISDAYNTPAKLTNQDETQQAMQSFFAVEAL